MKRLFDILFSSIGLIALAPLFLIVAILIKLDSLGPVFYRQKRIGRNFKPFYIYKFRTMIQDAEKKGLQITAAGDERITKIGRWLRKTKIDELPQLINVLKGEMSFVGPRPEVEKYVKIYRKDYSEILKFRPGITDIASITYRDEESVLKDSDDPEEYYKNILLPQKINFAKEYIKNHSLFFDVKLIFLTFFKIIFPNHFVIVDTKNKNA
jgi:lipopolysaccharide/colanic/teichoic acid biosynthesis glycosyltransferase